jgi:hypothetical protein
MQMTRILLKMLCGHTFLLKDYPAHENAPQMSWCTTCERVEHVQDSVSAMPQRGPDGKI